MASSDHRSITPWGQLADGWGDYNPAAIESRWQQIWEETGIYQVGESRDRQKYYCLNFFPYPSGEGLHVGHCRNYIPTDVIARFLRMSGANVLYPMGWDAFGEPTEQFAVAHGVHPRVTTDQNTANFRRQLTMIGTSYDWSREIDSSKPEYYRWTQWFFTLLYRRGLAYRDTNWQWWCPTCQTTLSSHEATGGVCWRGHAGVTRLEIPAWYFRITAYADELLSGLEDIDWPNPVKQMQKNWIGRSEGCEIIYKTEYGEEIPVFTTRPDTAYGATFVVLAPENPLVEALTTDGQRAVVRAYAAQAARQSEIERMLESREISGVFTGAYVIHPLTAERIPVWIADYVLSSYGSGAVMGVPAHDQRDYDFALRYGLEIRVVIAPPEGQVSSEESAYTGAGVMIHSGPFTGVPSEQGAEQVCEFLTQRGSGGRKVIYRMRDWLISRQRYWGTPIPIIYCDQCGTLPVPEEQLPVLLPPMDDFLPDGSGRSPLARVPEFFHTSCPNCAGPARRETDTMGGFACSSWYFLRFTSPHYDQAPFEPGAMRYWMPVDMYVGGAEHAVLHLLYARFWTKVLADAGLVPFREPFSRLLNQGQLMGPDGQRMSKSRGNVITPDSMVETYGADALRLYELFIAPFDQDVDWMKDGINGTSRLLYRVWNLYRNSYFESANSAQRDDELERRVHSLIRRVTEKIATLRFNTMVSDIMEFTNLLTQRRNAGSWDTITYHKALDTFMILLAPCAPHIAEELWSLTGHEDSVHQQPWPDWDEELAAEKIVQLAIQVDGKVRDVIEVADDIEEEKLMQIAREREKLQQHLAGKSILKTYYVPGKILNLVTSANSP